MGSPRRQAVDLNPNIVEVSGIFVKGEGSDVVLGGSIRKPGGTCDDAYKNGANDNIRSEMHNGWVLREFGDFEAGGGKK